MYIKINLLPPELRRKKVFLAFGYRTVLVMLSIIAVVALAGYYFHIDSAIKFQDSELTTWRQAEALLQDVVNLQDEVNKLRDDVATRINIIQELTGDSDMRLSILQYINAVTPENLWLLRISERSINNRIIFNIEGMSYSKQNISKFIASLQEYENFETVTLESIRPSPLEIQDAFQYSVNVEPKFTMVEEAPVTTSSRRRSR